MVYHIVSVGGGIASSAMLPLIVAAKYGKENLRLVMAKLPNEHPDTWRMIDEISSLIGVPVDYIGNGEAPYDHFIRVKFLGNSRVDPCSKNLKRDVVKKYVTSNFKKGEAVIHVGIGLYEIDRSLSIRQKWKELGYEVEFDLQDYPEFDRDFLIQWYREKFGYIPQLYDLGFSHNNCGGACIKAGKKQWAMLLYYSECGILKTEGLPTFDLWMKKEQEFNEAMGTSYTILKDEPLDNFKARMLEKWEKVGGFRDVASVFKYKYTFEDEQDTPACSWCDAAG